MSTEIVKRVSRIAGPPMPEEQIEMAEPPVLGEPPHADLGSMTAMLPMALGTGTMGLPVSGFSLACAVAAMCWQASRRVSTR